MLVTVKLIINSAGLCIRVKWTSVDMFVSLFISSKMFSAYRYDLNKLSSVSVTMKEMANMDVEQLKSLI